MESTNEYTALDFEEIKSLSDEGLEAARKANGKAWFAAQMEGRFWVAEIQREMRLISSEKDSRRFR